MLTTKEQTSQGLQTIYDNTVLFFIQNQLIFAVEKSILLINLTVPPSTPFALLVSFSTRLSKLI